MQEEIEKLEMEKEEALKEDLGMELIDLEKAGGAPEKKKVEKEKEEEEPFNLIKEIISLLVTMAVAAGVVFLLKEFVMINAFIPSGSMENTIQPEDRLIGSRLSYMKESPERGDIVIFRYPDDEEQLFVKRIIGLPGELVTIEDARVYIGEEQVLLEEEYLKEEWVVDNGPYTFEVPEGCYLVLGDNRNNSKDARYWDNTYVEEEQILGKAVFRYWPFSSIGTLD